jgi:tyrosine-protein kinase Etk/Wzc
MKKDTKDFMYYYALLLNNWYWLVLGLIVGVSSFYVNLRYSITLYKVSGSILIEDTQGKSLSKEIVAMGAGADQADASIEDRIKILSSTELMSRIVDSLTLNVSYVEEGRMKTYEMFDNSPLKLLYWNTEGAAKNFQIRIKHYDSLRFALYRGDSKPEYIKYGVPFKHDKRELVLKKNGYLSNNNFINIIVKDAYNTAVEYSSRLEIAQLGRSNILNISMIEIVPERAVAIINRLIQEYGLSLMENKNDAGKRTMSFIEQRLSYVASELYSVENREEGFRREKSLPIMLPAVAKSYMDKSSLMEEKINALDIRADLVKNIESIIVAQNPTEKYRPLPFSTEILGSGPLTILIQRYNDIIYKRSQIMESAKENNPMLTSNDEELKNLKNNILISIQTIKQEVNEQKEKYRQQMVPLEKQLSLMPSNERELTKIMREKGIKETLFLYLLQKREEIALNVAAQVAHSRMLERATNKGKVAPHPVQMALFYIFLGLGIPIFGLYVKDLFNNKVFHRADLDKYLNAPFVGFIPHVRGKSQKLIINDSHSVLSESFRLVRSNLQNTDFENKKKTILVTSTISGEGKSFVAVNLALTLALTGKKIIILGLDLRRPKLELYLDGKTSEKGIANFLKGEGPLSKFIQKFDRMPNVDYIDCGKVPENPAELMVFDKLKIMFDYCQKHYDFVVVDAPPIGMVADTFSLKEYIGQTLIVFRYSYSRIEHIKFVKEIQTLNKLPHLNMLLNDVRPERGNKAHYVNYSNYYKQENKSVFTKIKNWLKSLSKTNVSGFKNWKVESVNDPLKESKKTFSSDPDLIVENENESNKVKNNNNYKPKNLKK